MKKTCKHDIKEKTIFQQRLIELRKEKGFESQKQLADIIGVSRDCIVQWENNADRQPALDKLILLADTFEVSLDYLLGRSCCRSVDNEYIHQQLGLSDIAINKLKRLVGDDNVLAESNLKSNEMLSSMEDCSINPINLPQRIPAINTVIESKQFPNLVSNFCSYANALCGGGINLLDGKFHKLPNNTLYLADKDFSVIGGGISIDGISNAAWMKNMLDGQLVVLSREYIQKNK